MLYQPSKMLPQTILFFSVIVSRCTAHVVSPHNRHGLALHGSDTNTPTSTDLSTEIEAMHETVTLSTTSLQTASETDRITITSGDSKSHTQVVTHSSAPTTTVTKNSVSTINIDQTYRTLTEKETVTEPSVSTATAQPPQTKTRTKTEEVAGPKATCCNFSGVQIEGPYPTHLADSPIDLTCLHPRWRASFRRHIDPTYNNSRFCAAGTPMLHDFWMKVFNGGCYRGEIPEKDIYEIYQEEGNEMHIKCFSGFMETLCGFHIITNTGHEIDKICGKDW